MTVLRRETVVDGIYMGTTRIRVGTGRYFRTAGGMHDGTDACGRSVEITVGLGRARLKCIRRRSDGGRDAGGTHVQRAGRRKDAHSHKRHVPARRFAGQWSSGGIGTRTHADGRRRHLYERVRRRRLRRWWHRRASHVRVNHDIIVERRRKEDEKKQ